MLQAAGDAGSSQKLTRLQQRLDSMENEVRSYQGLQLQILGTASLGLLRWAHLTSFILTQLQNETIRDRNFRLQLAQVHRHLREIWIQI